MLHLPLFSLPTEGEVEGSETTNDITIGKTPLPTVEGQPQPRYEEV